MFVVVDGSERMARASQRMAGRLDHAFNLAAGEQFVHIVSHIGLAALQRIGAARRVITLLRPADAVKRFPRLADIEISDGDHVETGDALRLRQNHGTELAGTDETHPDGLATGCALRQKRIEIHVLTSFAGEIAGESAQSARRRPCDTEATKG
ncbi:hypothetical protein D3C87_1360890 [compost metagenome]